MFSDRTFWQKDGSGANDQPDIYIYIKMGTYTTFFFYIYYNLLHMTAITNSRFLKLIIFYRYK